MRRACYRVLPKTIAVLVSVLVNAKVKFWSKLFTEKYKEKFLISCEIRNFLVETTGLEPVTSCVWRNLPKTASNLCAAVGCGFWFSVFCNIFCKWSPESIGIYRTKPPFMTRQPCDTALLYFSQIQRIIIWIKKFFLKSSKNYWISGAFLAYSTL